MRSEELRIKCAPYDYGLYFGDTEIAFGPIGWYYTDGYRYDDVPYTPEYDGYEDYIDEFIEYIGFGSEKKYLIWFIKEFVVLDYILDKLDNEHMAFLEKYGFAIKSVRICRPSSKCYNCENAETCRLFKQEQKIVNKYIL